MPSSWAPQPVHFGSNPLAPPVAVKVYVCHSAGSGSSQTPRVSQETSWLSSAVQSLPQEIPAGELVTVPVVFVLEPDRDVVWTAVDAKPKSTRSLRRLANIAANPRVSLLVDHYDEDWTRLWWVRADGQASITVDSDPAARVHPAFPINKYTGARGTAVVYFEVEPGEYLPTHTDSAEEILYIVSGTGIAHAGEESGRLSAGDLAVIPEMVPHGIANDGDEMMGHNAPPIGAEWAAPAAPTYFNYRKVSIYGGSNEIQRNILAKAVLGF